jgi:glycosyltransferase involved in cell wall biosynthesis
MLNAPVKPKVLLIAEAANPEWSSVPLIGWSLSSAIAEQVDAHVVTQVRNKEAFLRAGLREGEHFTSIDTEPLERPVSKLANWLRGGNGKGWTTLTALSSITYPYFEHLVWQQFGKRIRSGHFSVVHRITPLTPTAPSLLAKRCSKAGVPFILGPLNGGVPWPKEFDRERRQEREWLSYVRSAYRWLPNASSTIRHAAFVIAGSRYTMSQLPSAHTPKYIYMPENGIDPNRFWRSSTQHHDGVLKAAFVGRLVPYKGPDMLLAAARDLLKDGRMTLDIVGDGPMMPELTSFVREHGLEHAVKFHGWLPNDGVQDVLGCCQILPFPSIREFGGGVVLEAMALGVVPIVVDYAGPGELVSQDVGIKVPLGSREEITHALRAVLRRLIDDRKELEGMSLNGIRKIREEFTWEAKARQIRNLYEQALTPKGTMPSRP